MGFGEPQVFLEGFVDGKNRLLSSSDMEKRTSSGGGCLSQRPVPTPHPGTSRQDRFGFIVGRAIIAVVVWRKGELSWRRYESGGGGYARHPRNMANAGSRLMHSVDC